MGSSGIKKLLSSKQAQLALRFFTYGVMAVSTVVLTATAIFYAMGYRFNQASLAVEQGGLVQLRSTPASAKVTVDGKEKNELDTPSRAYLSAGAHAVEMRLDGYETWKRSFDLQAGQLLWLDYARLLPSEIKNTPLHTSANMFDAKFSPDRRWLLVKETLEGKVFHIFDLSDETKPTVQATTIPDDQVTLVDGKTGTFSLLEWDFGSRSVLIRHDVGNVSEVIRIDRTRTDQAVNISKLFGLTISNVHFAGGNQSVVYAQTGDVLRRLDIDSSTASAALVTGVVDFTIYGEDRIAFVAERQLAIDGASQLRKAVGIYQDGKEALVRDYPVDTSLKIDLTEYYRHQYLAISTGGKRVEVLRDPAEKAAETSAHATFDVQADVQWLNFSSNGRMISAGAGNLFSTYDLEVALAYSTNLEGLNISQPLEWLDDYYLWADAGGSIVLVEFDGQNRREVTKAISPYPVSLSQNGEVLFSLARSDAGVVLQGSQLILN